MSPQNITAWQQTIATAISSGLDIVGKVQDMIQAVHADLTPEQLAAAEQAILDDDKVRLAFAEQAAGGVA